MTLYQTDRKNVAGPLQYSDFQQAIKTIRQNLHLPLSLYPREMPLLVSRNDWNRIQQYCREQGLSPDQLTVDDYIEMSERNASTRS